MPSEHDLAEPRVLRVPGGRAAPQRSRPPQVRKQAFRDPASPWGHPQTRSQAGLEPTMGKATGCAPRGLAALMNPAPTDPYRGCRAGDINAEALRAKGAAGKRPGHVPTPRGASRSDWSRAPGSCCITLPLGGTEPAEGVQPCGVKMCFSTVYCKGGEKRKRDHGPCSD